MARGHYHSRKRRERATDVASFLLVILLAAGAMLPIWWIFRSSLMTNTELYAYPPAFFPSKWLFSNYVETLQTYDFWRYFKNTMTIIVPAVFGGTVTATLCGYAFARLKFRGKKFLFTLCVGSMLLPNMVTLIPLYLMWTRIFGLNNSYLPLILPYCLGGGAFFVFLLVQFVRSIPMELDEAAKIDGAGTGRIYWNIIFPLMKPSFVTVGIYAFIWSWDDFYSQMLYLNTASKYTVSLGLRMFVDQAEIRWGELLAMALLSIIPSVILFFVNQKEFVEGIATTGLKG